MLLKAHGQAVRSRRNGGIGVAVALDEINQQIALAMDVHVGRVGRQCVTAIRSGRQFLNVRLDQCQRILGNIAIVRHHQRNRFAHIRNLSAGQNEW